MFAPAFLLSLTLALSHADPEIIGYYSWNWGAGSTGSPGANAGCAFTGYTDVTKAISMYTPGASWCCPVLLGTKYITLGGGNSAGTFDEASLHSIADQIHAVIDAGYEGVMFDVEEVDGPSSRLVPAFATAFDACKRAGLYVAVTTSHSAPYQTDTPADAVALVKAWAADKNIDILSPQLYSSGQESAPEFAETNSCKDAGCTWELYKTTQAKFAPSIVAASQFDAVKQFFQNNSTLSISVDGFFQWAQTKSRQTPVK